MKLYFSPLACSLATRIALHEAGADATFVEVDPKTKQTSDGVDFRTIHSLGLVPTLEIEPGQILTENAAILQLVADRFPAARLAPTDALGRAHLQQWLCFIGTELHKSIYMPLLDREADPAVHAYAQRRVPSRLGWVASQLAGRPFVLDEFSVADAYLFAVLTWSQACPVDLTPWPTLRAYHAALRSRPSVARAFAEERALYQRERDRHAPRATGAGA